MRSCCARAAAVVLGLLAPGLLAGTLVVPLVLDYQGLERALVSELMPPQGEALQLLRDPAGCNEIDVEGLDLAPADDGRLHLLASIRVRTGTVMLGRCWAPLQWRGRIELIETVQLDADAQVGFRVVDSHLLAEDSDRRAFPDLFWELVKRSIHARVELVQLDLTPLPRGVSSVLEPMLEQSDASYQLQAELISFQAVGLDRRGLWLELAIPLGDLSVPDVVDESPLNEAELASWERHWQHWDGFFTWLMKALAADVDDELRSELGELMLDARYQLQRALAAGPRNADPVRELFTSSWTRLAPLLRERSMGSTGINTLSLLGFVTAGDALAALDAAGAGLGLDFNQEALRRFARLLDPQVDDAALQYATAEDSALRQMLGLPAMLPENPTEESVGWTLSIWPRAWAEVPAGNRSNDPWMPPMRADLDNYLGRVDALLATVAAAEATRGKVPAPYLPIYRDLLRATAWQETCWRQFVRSKGEIVPLRSSAGSVGLMQVNPHVWRGVYNLQSLADNIDYNARAGNEILVHYLVDYAVRKREHVLSGDVRNLARAAYAAYNGGPGHLERYRQPGTSPALRTIDAAFWSKYQAIGSQGAQAVRSCFPG